MVLSVALATAGASIGGAITAVGCFAGGQLACWIGSRRVQLLGKSLRLDFVAGVALLISSLLANLSVPHVVTAPIALLVPNLCSALIVSFALAALLGTASRVPRLIPLEPLVVGLLFCTPLLASSGGQFMRPQWLGDLAMEYNTPLPPLLALIGIGAAFLSLLQLACREKFRSGAASVTLLLLCAAAAWLIFKVSGPVKTQSIPPEPPVSFAGDPPPPPPPEPNTIAAIQFSKVHAPLQRLGGYFFRFSDSPDKTLHENSEADFVETKIYYLDQTAAPLSLAGKSAFQSIPVPGRRFQKAERILTVVPGTQDKSDIETRHVRRACELDLVPTTPEAQPPEIAAILNKVRAIMAGKERAPKESFLESSQSAIRLKPDRMDSTTLLALCITEWIELNGDYSDGEQSQNPNEPSPTIVDFVNNGLKGNSKDFALLGEALLKAGGITSRVMEGFFHPVESVPLDRIVLSDSHRETWLEVLTKKGDWIILPVRPAKVSDREPPPPQEDVKQELFDEIEDEAAETLSDISARPPVSKRGIPSLLIGFILLMGALIIWKAITVFALPIRRILSVPDEHAHRQALAESARRATRFFRAREFGESWSGFSKNMETSLPRHARRFQKLLDFHSRAEGAKWNPPMNLETAVIRASRGGAALAYSFFAASTLFLPERFFCKKNNDTTQAPKT
jgi:hypothetical protein